MLSCSVCKREKSSDLFKKSNNIYYKSCIDCRLRSNKHYELNKSKILNDKYKKVTCDCGSVVMASNLSSHKRTVKHGRLMNKPDTEKTNKYHITYWHSKIDNTTYYYKSKSKTKMIKCFCGQRFYPNQKQYDRHIMSEHHLYFVDILRHSKPYDDEHVIYEKIKY